MLVCITWQMAVSDKNDIMVTLRCLIDTMCKRISLKPDDLLSSIT